MKFLKLLAPVIFCCSWISVNAGPTPATQNEISKFKTELVDKFKFKAGEVEKVLKQAHYNETIIKTMNAPYEEKSYSDYRKLFLTPQRISEGKEFLIKHNSYLDKVAKQYGVSPEIIVAIIGVESNYGKNKTQFSTLDSLYTLSFFYPKRANFFRYELAQFLLLCRELKLDPTSIKGSYAGALGIPQFMPSSYRHFARTTSTQHNPNLFDDKYDAMTSIGNYLRHFGWIKDEQPAIKANLAKRNGSRIEYNKIYSVKDLDSKGITAETKISPQQKVRLIQVDQDTNTPSTWLGLGNFDVIKKYNKSDLYVLAVTELASLLSEKKA
ncbi:MAG: lytic murein transglycosylase B [Pseudomonadota bacterium]|nr:lytic murein transglycosylase B [Pseudomonadota bacterium]